MISTALIGTLLYFGTQAPSGTVLEYTPDDKVMTCRDVTPEIGPEPRKAWWIRCENSEVICYRHGQESEGIQCSFKPQPSQEVGSPT